MPNAEELLKWEDYKDSTGKTLGTTRQATASMEWLVSATNGKTYAIRFDNNFAKKHLYTSTKKADKIEAEPTSCSRRRAVRKAKPRWTTSAKPRRT